MDNSQFQSMSKQAHGTTPSAITLSPRQRAPLSRNSDKCPAAGNDVQKKNPGFAFTAIISIGLAIGANSSILDPEIVEEWKWENPVWSHNGLVCTGETYKSVVKMRFAKGASLKDPSRLFNSSLEGKVRRAIDIRECDDVNQAALKDLVRAAVALNLKSK